METPMQELIEDLKNNMVISIFERLEREGIFIKALEKEKEQMVETFEYGYFCAASGTDEEFELDGRTYYDKVYKKYELDNESREILNKL